MKTPGLVHTLVLHSKTLCTTNHRQKMHPETIKATVWRIWWP